MTVTINSTPSSALPSSVVDQSNANAVASSVHASQGTQTVPAANQQVPTSNSYTVSVSSQSTTVGLYYDPALRERNEKTAALNSIVRYGYIPPKTSTRS